MHRSSTFLSALFLVEFLLDVLLTKVCSFQKKKDVLTVSSCPARLYPKLHALDFLQPEKKVIRNKERTDFEIFWQLNITRARGLGHFSSEFSYTLSVATHKSREPKRKDEIRKKKKGQRVGHTSAVSTILAVGSVLFSEPLEKERKDVAMQPRAIIRM